MRMRYPIVAGGRFKPGRVLPDNYKVKAWPDSQITFEHPMAVRGGSTLQVNLP